MSPSPEPWDFFIIHSARDAELARRFYDELRRDFRVFLDRESLPAGSAWDEELFRAMQQTRVFLVLVTPHFDESHFAREEYQIAINIRRQSPSVTSVVPITTEPRALMPYGLGVFQGLDFARQGGLAGVVERLRVDFAAVPVAAVVERPPRPAHPLHEFSRRGRAPAELVTENLVVAFASLHDPILGPTLGLIFVEKANAFRKAADPGDGSASVIEAYTLPPVGMVSPLIFWRSVLSEARLHSPRMLAAVLMTANANAFSEPARDDHRTLLNHLRSMPH